MVTLFRRRLNYRKQLNLGFNSAPEFENDWYLILENFSDDPKQR
jgi:hypothetical protein